MADIDNLGKVSAWQIKEFPEGLREEIARQAKQARMSVGEFVTGIMVQARDAGWRLDGAAGKPFETSKPPANLGDLSMLVDMACKVADHAERMPKGTAAIANRLIKRSLTALSTPKGAVGPARAALVNGSVNGLKTISGPAQGEMAEAAE
jgi:hypothetical protein